MKKEYTTPNQSIELHKLGFNEKCLGYYDPQLEDNIRTSIVPATTKDFLDDLKKLPDNVSKSLSKIVLLPLWQQAFDFFASKYNLDGYIITTSFGDLAPYISKFGNLIYNPFLNNNEGIMYPDMVYQTRIFLLNKLIEIVKNERENKR